MERAPFLVDIAQSIGIILIALVLIYIVIRLERALTVAAKKVKPAIKRQQGIEAAIERAVRQLAAVEQQVEDREAALPIAHLKVMTASIRARLDEITTINKRLERLEAKHGASPAATEEGE